MLYFCHACGEAWPSDPRLGVPCPVCHAGIGARCKKPSGHRQWSHEQPHLEREQLAVDLGMLPRCATAEKQLSFFRMK